MDCSDVASMNVGGMPAPCTPSPQPGDKPYLHDEDDIPLGDMCEGMTQLDGKSSTPQGPTPTAVPSYYTQYYQYAPLPGANTPHYGPTLMYMPMPYYPQMRQSTPNSYHVPEYNSNNPALSPKSHVEPPTIVKTPSRQRVVIWNYCQFCQNNREPEEFYRAHILRDAEGKVVCPVLRAYNCPICNNGGGDRAHTKSYCPQLRTSRLPRRSSLF